MSEFDNYWTIGEIAFYEGHGNEYGFPDPTGLQLIHHYNGGTIGFLRLLWRGSEIFCALTISYDWFIGFQLLELPWFSILCFVADLDGNIDFNLGPIHWDWFERKWQFPWTYFS